MKKLMIAAAIVCAAAFAQAASCSWSSGTITDYTGATVGKDAVTAYLYSIDSDAFTSYSAMTSEALSKALYEDFTAKSASTVTTPKNSTSGGTANISQTISGAFDSYMALVYVDNNHDKYVLGNVVHYTYSGSGTAKVNDLALNIGGDTTGVTKATAWVNAVPEPTSGLLLLLGVAGLALRRRRA